MVTPAQLEKEYQEWIIKMHNQYDEEADATAEDNPVIIVSPPNKKALGISKEGMTCKILMAITSIYDCCLWQFKPVFCRKFSCILTKE